MNYQEATDYIKSTLKFGIKLGLDRMNTLLSLMDNPHKKMKYVHVAGTNGKGSTVAFISSMLIEAGYKVGIYTSPSIERFSDRIRINNIEINEDELIKNTEFVKSKIDVMTGMGDEHPTEFEITTAVAFQHFYDNDCDIVVLEVGLGGRYDSTNVIDTPLVAVITTISYDHMDKLGNTIREIASIKAGIIKEFGDVVLYPQKEETEKIFRDICIQKHAALYKVDFKNLNVKKSDIDGQKFDYCLYRDLKIQLLGEHQVKNAVTSIAAIEILNKKGFNVSKRAVKFGLLKTVWPGRLEIVSRHPLVIIDGAHNVEGVSALYDALISYFPKKPGCFIMGVLKDKEYLSMVKLMAPAFDRVITVTPKSDRALSAEDLAIVIKPYCNNVYISDTIENAIEESLRTASLDTVIIAFGSLYYIGDVRKYFKDTSVVNKE
jgi:dihydrofolate synthase / folylpolyglutamate synthase